jgi:hypothetical protein
VNRGGLRGSSVGILNEVFWALLMVGVPIALFTLVLVFWALQRGHFRESLDARALVREMKAMSRANKKNKKEGKNNKEEIKPDSPQHPVQKKWAKFGGGFYGVVAFFTYIIVEVTEITTMIINFGGFFDFLKQLDLSVIINIFVEAITNFITAMIWPVYWMDRIDMNQTWIWFVMAYAGYWLGLKLAQVLNQRHPGTEI